MAELPVTSPQLLADCFTRIEESSLAAIEGLSAEQLAHRPTQNANSIGWLIWHLARVQDDHVAAVAGLEQVYVTQGWHDRLGLPLDRRDIGYGHSAAQVGLVRVESSHLLGGYLRAVTAQTHDFLARLRDDDLAKVVDERWDPPVTLAVRLVSVVSDCLQHAGQGAYLRGLLVG